MAVRLALGARRKQLLALVLGGGWRLMLAGGAVGLAGFVAVERYVSRQFYGVGASDPWAIGGALAVLLAAGTVAALAPGVRAARTDPAQALRDA
jgi:ABC-type antimicrobial peptide transport system permease subunit